MKLDLLMTFIEDKKQMDKQNISPSVCLMSV